MVSAAKVCVWMVLFNLVAPSITGLQCYECYSSRNPRICTYHRECSQNEKCGMHKTQDLLGETVYHLECLYETICDGSESPPNVIGRRKRDAFKPEVTCCDTDLCNREINTLSTTEGDAEIMSSIGSTTVPGCHDNSACAVFGLHVCNNVVIATQLCPATCNQCRGVASSIQDGGSTSSGLQLTSPGLCQDRSTECPYLQSSLHICEHFDAVIHFGCLKSCGLCDSTSTIGSIPTTETTAMPSDTKEPQSLPLVTETTAMPSDTKEPQSLPLVTETTVMPSDTQGPHSLSVATESTVVPSDTQRPQSLPLVTETTVVPSDTQGPHSLSVATESTVVPSDTQRPHSLSLVTETTVVPLDTKEPHSLSPSEFTGDGNSCIDDVLCSRPDLDYTVVCKDVATIQTYKCYHFCRRCDLQFYTTQERPSTSTPRPSLCDVTPRSGGEEFVFLYPTNKVPSDSHLDLLLASNETGSLTLRGLRGFVCLNYTYTTGSKRIEVPQSLQLSKEAIENKAIQVITSNDVTLHAMYHDPSNIDGFFVLPVRDLSDTYVIPSFDKNGIFKTFIGVTAVRDSTTIQIKLHTDQAYFYDGNAYNDRQTLTIHLNALEAFELTHTGDVTGTLVKSNYPIAVQAGSQCSSVPVDVGTCNHLQEMVPPVSRLGSIYIVPPLVSTQAYFVRVIAAYPMTVVDTKISDHSEMSGFILSEVGDFRNIEVNSPEILFINSSHPVLVAHYAEGLGRSEPAMTIIPSVHQFRLDYDITVSDRPGFDNYLSIIIPTNNINDIRINRVNLTSHGYFNVHNGTYDLLSYIHSSVEVKVVPGVYHVYTEPRTTEFGLIVYGVSNGNAYEYPGGL